MLCYKYATYCQVAVDVISKVEYFGSSPAGQPEEFIKVSLNTKVTQKERLTICFIMQCIQWDLLELLNEHSTCL